MNHPNFYKEESNVTYYGSVADLDFYMTNDMDIIIQHGSKVHQCMCMPLRHARKIEAVHYQAAVTLWDLHESAKELA